LQAIDAITNVVLPVLAVFRPWFTAPVIVGNDYGVCIQQNALEPSVWTNDGADLFPEVGVYTVKHCGKKDNRGKPGHMEGNRLCHDPPQFPHTDDIGQEEIGNDK
jgi:hypothetical protein